MTFAIEARNAAPGPADRQEGPQLRQALLDVIDDFHGVGAGLLADQQCHGRLAVHTRQRPRLNVAVGHRADVTNGEGAAADVADDAIDRICRFMNEVFLP